MGHFSIVYRTVTPVTDALHFTGKGTGEQNKAQTRAETRSIEEGTEKEAKTHTSSYNH